MKKISKNGADKKTSAQKINNAHKNKIEWAIDNIIPAFVKEKKFKYFGRNCEIFVTPNNK